MPPMEQNDGPMPTVSTGRTASAVTIALLGIAPTVEEHDLAAGRQCVVRRQQPRHDAPGSGPLDADGKLLGQRGHARDAQLHRLTPSGPARCSR